MVVVPDDERVRKFLTLKYRMAVKNGRKMEIVNMTEEMYQATQTADGRAGLITYQGFWYKLSEHLKSLGEQVHITDVRPKFFVPNLGAAMLGLRPPQRPWIARALLTGDSGLIGAPTRFGKSYGMTAICKAFQGAKTVVVAPGVSLCEQLYEHFKEVFGNSGLEIHGVYTGSKHRVQSKNITIVSMDSLDKMDPDDTDLIIVDEPHALVSESRLEKFSKFHKARKYGFGATLDGRFDKKDRLIEGAIGPVISNVTYKEAVELGSISPLKVLILKIPFSKDVLPGWQERDVVYDRLLCRSQRIAATVRQLAEEAIPMNWQTMAFICHEKQADYVMEKALPKTGTVAMAKKMTNKERSVLTNKIAAGELYRVVASNIYVQGVTFPDLRVVLNLAGGGANTTAIQKPGRLLQVRPNKNYGVMIDFMFECSDADLDLRTRKPYTGIIGECWARHDAYQKIGYDVEFINYPTSMDRVREVILGSYNRNETDPPIRYEKDQGGQA